MIPPWRIALARRLGASQHGEGLRELLAGATLIDQYKTITTPDKHPSNIS
jgi:hypothetical protein